MLHPAGDTEFWFILVTLLQWTRAAEHVGGFQVVGIEEGSHLIGQLGQDTLSQGHAASLELSEGHKLDNVPGGNVPLG